MRIHGLEPRQGETAFAFLVLRFAAPASRTTLASVVRQFAPIIPDVEEFLAELPSDEDFVPFQLLGMPWLPPEAGSDVELQRRLVEAAGAKGVDEAWFFQTGTSLPTVGGDEDDPFSDDDVGMSTGIEAAAYVEQAVDVDSYTDDGSEGTQPVQIYPAVDAGDEPDEPDEPDDDDDDDDEDDEDEDYGDDDEDDATWSHGPPPVVTSVRFPVDGYPAILEELDWEDVGIAFKLAGPALGGEGTVLVGFHALWLSPYGGRHRNAAVTIDRRHHSAHLWVDRFAVPSSAAEQVGHLLWILSKLDEIVPVVHARFGGATMQQKYGGLMGDTSEPFVLGGNPLLAVHAEGGEEAVDRWIAGQTDWSSEEVAQMLRELAIEIVTSGGETGEEEEIGDEDIEEAVDALFDDNDEDDDDDDDDEDDEDDAKRTRRLVPLSDADTDDEDDDDDDEDDDDDGDGGDDDEDDDAEDAEDADDDAEDEEADRSRYVARYATEVLVERAKAGLLDARVADTLRPILATAERYEHRRTRVIQILGALRDAASVPALVHVLETSPIKSLTDSITKDDLLAATSEALGAIGDASAIPALAAVITQAGSHSDDPRAPAAHALAACLAATPEPRDVSDAVLDAMLKTIALRNDGELNAELHFAYGKLAQTVSPARRDHMRARLAEEITSRSDGTPSFARAAAFTMAGEARLDELRAGLHRTLGEVDYNHEHTVRNIRFALRIAEHFPELVDKSDVAWLVLFEEPDIRAGAHALLARLGAPIVAALTFDPTTVGRIGDDDLVALLAEPHVVGRASLVAEAGRRRLAAARPAIVKAAHAAIERARSHGDLLDPDAKLLEAAVVALRGHLDADTIALFDRMLRHSNFHVKWELLQQPPEDDRLIGGMFVVLAAKWGWQHTTAKAWLSERQGSAVFEEERKRAGVVSLAADADDDDADGVDDDEMN